MTQRDRLCNAKEHLSEVDALLSAWINDWKRTGEVDPTHDRIVLARQSIRDAFGWLEASHEDEGGSEPGEEPPAVGCERLSSECVPR